MSESWTEKYRPEKWSDIAGNNKDVKSIRKWAEDWSPGDDPILLEGPPGTGKTSTAEVIAKEMGYPLQEVNTSDSRGADDVEQLVQSIQTTPVEAERQVVLLDEADSWHHATDLSALSDALEDPENPVVLAVNSTYDTPNSLKKHATEYSFKTNKRTIKSRLKDIVEAENVDIADADLDSLAERPDLRSAVNDLQRWAEEDVPPTSDDRTFDEGPWGPVRRLLGGVSTDSGYGMTPDDMVMWLDENARKNLRGVEAMIVYDTLARADKWLGQTNRTQNYHWWKYAGNLVDHVGRLRLQEPHDGWMNIDTPTWFKSSMPNPTGDSPEARLYRKVNDSENGTFQFGGGYTYFRRVLIPIIEEQPLDVKKDFVVNYRLEKDEAEVIGVSKSTYNDLMDTDVPESRQETEAEINQSSALDASW